MDQSAPQTTMMRQRESADEVWLDTTSANFVHVQCGHLQAILGVDFQTIWP